MSKKLSDVPTVSWGSGWVITDGDLQYLQGRIFTILESMGLKDTQEKSTKDLMKEEIFAVFKRSMWISCEQNNRLHREMFEGQKGSTIQGSTIPRPSI